MSKSSTILPDDLKPDIDFLKDRLSAFRILIDLYDAGGVHFARRYGLNGSTRIIDDNDTLKRMDFEFILLQLQTQERLVETMERSIKSQDRLANSQLVLALIGAVIALLQLVGMFIV